MIFVLLINRLLRRRIIEQHPQRIFPSCGSLKTGHFEKQLGSAAKWTADHVRHFRTTGPFGYVVFGRYALSNARCTARSCSMERDACFSPMFGRRARRAWINLCGNSQNFIFAACRSALVQQGCGKTSATLLIELCGERNHLGGYDAELYNLSPWPPSCRQFDHGQISPSSARELGPFSSEIPQSLGLLFSPAGLPSEWDILRSPKKRHLPSLVGAASRPVTNKACMHVG